MLKIVVEGDMHFVLTQCLKPAKHDILETLVSLEVLRADRCVKLKSIQELEQLSKLGRLSVSGCSQLKELPNYVNISRFGDRQMCEVEEHNRAGAADKASTRKCYWVL